MRLTVKRVERLKQPGRYADGNGLYLQVISAKNRSWIFSYERNGRERMLGIGPLHTFGLREARELARLARQQLYDGIDPLEAKASAKAARAIEQAKTITFEAAAREYFAQTEQKWRNVKHSAQFLASMESYVFDKIGNLPVAAIDTGQVLRVLEQHHNKYPGKRLWDAIPETANRVRKRIETVLSWAAVRGYRPKGDNPARWSGNIEHTLPARNKIQKPVHHAALPYAELPAFFAKLNKRDGVTARALEFTILTAARTGETLGATWDEIDFAARMWTVPAGRIKGGRTHRVPLSDAAIAVPDKVHTGRQGLAAQAGGSAACLRRSRPHRRRG
jgi:integrase